MLASAVRRAMSQRSAYVSVSLSGPSRGARDLIEAPGLAFQGEEASGSVRRDACAAATTAAGYVMRCASQSRELGLSCTIKWGGELVYRRRFG